MTVLQYCLAAITLGILVAGEFPTDYCEPQCLPPKMKCFMYKLISVCPAKAESLISLRASEIPEALCGCQWRRYLEKVEPSREIIFTRDGAKCFEWAFNACEMAFTEGPTSGYNDGISIKEPGGVGEADPLVDIFKRLARLERGEYIIAADDEKTATKTPLMETDFYGKVNKASGQKWISVNPQSPKGGGEVGGGEAQTGQQSVDGPTSSVQDGPTSSTTGYSNRFKLWVFGGIIFFIVLSIVLAMIFRMDSKAEGQDQWKAGDLEPCNYSINPKYKQKKWNHFDKFLDKLRTHYRHKARQNSQNSNREPRNVSFSAQRNHSVSQLDPGRTAAAQMSPGSNITEQTFQSEQDYLDHTYDNIPNVPYDESTRIDSLSYGNSQRAPTHGYRRTNSPTGYLQPKSPSVYRGPAPVLDLQEQRSPTGYARSPPGYVQPGSAPGYQEASSSAGFVEPTSPAVHFDPGPRTPPVQRLFDIPEDTSQNQSGTQEENAVFYTMPLTTDR